MSCRPKDRGVEGVIDDGKRGSVKGVVSDGGTGLVKGVDVKDGSGCIDGVVSDVRSEVLMGSFVT